MILGGVLGANLWLVATVAPIWAGSAVSSLPSGQVLSLLLLVISCPAALVVGLYRRSGWMLLTLFPFLTLLPLLVRQPARLALPLPPWSLVAASLGAYLVAAAFSLERDRLRGSADGAATAASSAPEERPLAMEPIPSRWRRRLRVYRMLSAAALVLPLGLVWALDLRSSTVEAISRGFGPQADAARALFTGGVGLVSLFLFRHYLAAPLESHLSQDRETRMAMEEARQQARRGRPRLSFYLFVVLALGGMAAVVWERTR
jgi:hypothetical protein